MEQLFLSTIGLGLAYCATPGAVNAESLRCGLAGGFRQALLVQIGSLIGDTLWAAVALTGTAFLVQNRSLRIVLGIAGACLLLRLAWSAIKDALAGSVPETQAARGRGAFLTGAFFSLTNPSAVAFWLGIGGGVDRHGRQPSTVRRGRGLSGRVHIWRAALVPGQRRADRVGTPLRERRLLPLGQRAERQRTRLLRRAHALAHAGTVACCTCNGRLSTGIAHTPSRTRVQRRVRPARRSGVSTAPCYRRAPRRHASPASPSSRSSTL